MVFAATSGPGSPSSPAEHEAHGDEDRVPRQSDCGSGTRLPSLNLALTNSANRTVINSVIASTSQL